MVITSLKYLFDFSYVGCSSLTSMHVSLLGYGKNVCNDNVVHFSLVISLQPFFSQIHGPLYEYLYFVTVCYFVHYFETVVFT